MTQILGDQINVGWVNPSVAQAILEEITYGLRYILEVHTSANYIYLNNNELSQGYVFLKDDLETILNRPDFAELKKAYPESLPENLAVSNFQYYDSEAWNIIKSDLASFISQLEKERLKPYSFSEDEKAFMKLIKIKIKEICDFDSEHTSALISEEKRFIKILPNKVIETVEPQINTFTRHTGLNIPLDTKWGGVTIHFIDGHEVQIRIHGLDKPELLNYKEMGFQDDKKHTPDLQWQLLETFARGKGVVRWGEFGADKAVVKRKQILSKKLKAFFCLEEDPFYKYSKKDGYKIKISLLDGPLSHSSLNKDIVDDLGIAEYHRSLAPSLHLKDLED